VRDIRRHTRKQYSAEEKIRIVLEGLRGEDSIAELCRREGINPNVYYRWSKDFMEAGESACQATWFVKRRLMKPRPYDLKQRFLKRPWVKWFWKIVYSKKAYSGMGRAIHEIFNY
jgi:hypothetical protein